MTMISLTFLRTSAFFRGLLLVLAFMMLGTTVADAAECGTEFQNSEISMSVLDEGSSNQTPDQNIPENHGVCQHGHCHHGNMVTAGISGSDLSERVESDPHHNVDQWLLSAHTSRLKRPPRA